MRKYASTVFAPPLARGRRQARRNSRRSPQVWNCCAISTSRLLSAQNPGWLLAPATTRSSRPPRQKIWPRRPGKSWRCTRQAAMDCPGPRRNFARREFWNFYALMNDNSLTTPIVAAFDAAADSYDAASKTQRDIARELVFRAAKSLAGSPKTILDLGSG